MRDTTGALAAWLGQGGHRVGQVEVSRDGSGWELRHAADAERDDLESFGDAEAARMLASMDEEGAYRPLKTAPNLRRGWRLVLAGPGEVRRALDFLYPAMLGVWLAEADGELAPVDLRETLGRQTGMYRVTQKLTDEQAQQLIARTCCPSACMKTILWRVDAGQPVSSLPSEKFMPDRDHGTLPLLCHEACNLLVAAARKVVKGE
jgi:sirohydrochlorin cobaltochelatase